MIQNIRSYIALMAAVLLLFSCAKDEAQGDSQPVPIQLTAAGIGTGTRAADGINDTNFPASTPITVAVDGTNYSYQTDATSVSNPMTCLAAIPPHFPVSGNSVHIVAYYPASMQYATTAQTFTVAADQSTEANYKASDLMVGLPQTTFEDANHVSLIEGTGFTRKVKPTSLNIPMEFEHKLVKIKVVVTINGAVVKKVTMKNVMRSIDFNPSDGTFAALSLASASDGLGDNVIIYDNSTGTSADFTCAAIIPEQNPAAATEFIDVVIQDSPSDKTLTYKLQENGDFESGKQYIYNLTVNNDEILCTTSVTDWDTAVDGTDYTHGDGLALTKNIKMNPLWYVAEGNMTNAKNASVLTMGSATNGYHYNWSDAMNTFASQTTGYDTYMSGNKIISGVDGTWHLPVHAEWLSIIPSIEPTSLFSLDTNNGGTQVTGPTVKFGYNSSTKENGEVDVSYWWKKSSTVLRAIRFIGTDYCSAWQYEMLGGSSASNYCYYRISSTLINVVKNFTEAATAISDEQWSTYTFGNDEAEYAVQKEFYALGYNSSGTNPSPNYVIGTHCGYWSATEYSNSQSFSFYFSYAYFHTNIESKPYGFCVRLFRDN